MYKIRHYTLDPLKNKQTIQLNGGSRLLRLDSTPLTQNIDLVFMENTDQPVETREIVCFTDDEEITIRQAEHTILGYIRVCYNIPTEPKYLVGPDGKNSGVPVHTFAEMKFENRVYLMSREVVY